MLARSLQISLLAAIIYMSGVVMACSPSTQPVPGTPSTGDNKGPQSGGVLRTMSGGYVSYGTVDSHRASNFLTTGFTGLSTNQVVKRNIMSGNYEIIPELAESWEVSQDGLTYTFKLRKGIKFHNVPPVNGREFTSDDVEYMIKRISADPAIVPDKWKSLFQRRSDFENVSSIEKPDKYSIVIKTKQADAVFLHNLAAAGTVVVPKELIDDNPDKLIQDKIIGTGPFIHKDYVPDVRHILERNPDYWKKDERGAQMPYLDKLERNFYSGGDISVSIAAFLSGQTDLIGFYSNITETDLATVTKQMSDKSYVQTSSSSNWQHLRINPNRAPFNDVRMRKAVNLAIDRQQIIESTSRGGAEISGLIAPALAGQGAYTVDELSKMPGYRQPKDQDIAEAKRLIKEAGYEGVTIDMNSSGSTAATADMMSLIKEQLSKVGINSTIKLTANYQDHLNEMLGDKFQLTYTGHGVSADVDGTVYLHFHSKGGRNYYKFSDAKWDQFAEKQRIAVNPEERKKVVREILAYHAEIVPNVPIRSGYIQDIFRNYVKGVGKPVESADPFVWFDSYWMEKH